VDANGTRFHLLLGQDDWLKRTTLSGVEWNQDCGEVALVRRPYEFPTSPGDNPPAIDDRRGAARDAFGNWYWISESQTEILARSSGSGATSLFWSPAIAATTCEPRDGAFEPVDVPESAQGPAALRGLVVTANHYLIVGTLEPNGLLVFDLHAGGAPQHLCWPPLVAFSPFDMTPSDARGAWILDRDNSCVWVLDAACRVVRRSAATMAVAETFVPADGTADPARIATTSAPLTAQDAWPAPADSVAIESLPGGALVILDRPATGASTVHYFSALGEAPSMFLLDSHNIIGHDIAYAAIPIEPNDRRVNGVFVVSRDGNQAHALTITTDGSTVTLTLVPQYFPMRLFGGKGLVAAGGDAYYDFNRTWIPLITQSRPRYGVEGSVVITNLDGHEPDCVWHRVLIDGSIPSDASVECWSRAANSANELATAPWQPEPRPYLRSRSELPFAPPVSGDGAGTWELLLQHARGQWLDLRLSLTGKGRSTPRFRSVRVYYPRFSYLQYLPAVYREDVDSAGFLDRFLANVEGTLTSIEDRIAASQALIDVRSAPPEALEWLASWVGLALDSTWDDRKRRLLLQHAPIVFARRGTIDGLRTALALSLFDCATPELFTDTGSRRSPAAAIRIVEQFRTRRVPAVVSGDPTQLTGIREVSPEARWTPKAGRDALDAAWGEVFPLVPPAERDRAQAWRALAMQTLGFVPAVADAGAGRWRQFLAGRYHGVSSYNEVYGATGHARIRSFDDITPPATLPPDGAPLLDWYEFETRVLAMTARAHQFLVLLPVSPDAQADAPEHQRALEIARRVTAIEKPAHTTFDVRFYWALFRVGEVRLGLDTLIARRPSLLSPFVLDRAHLAESYLAPSHPQDVRDRSLVIGRGRLEPPCITGEGS
jgi:phage tail-like protein